MNARVSCRLDVLALRRRPVGIVPRGHEHSWFREPGAAAIGVDAREVAHVVSVPLEPSHQGIFRVEELILERAHAIGERAVVAHHVGARRESRVPAACRRALVPGVERTGSIPHTG